MTPLPELTHEIAIDQLRNFFRGKPLVVFGSGISCAVDTQFGMTALRDALLTDMQTRSLAPEEERQWNVVHEALA